MYNKYPLHPFGVYSTITTQDNCAKNDYFGVGCCHKNMSTADSTFESAQWLLLCYAHTSRFGRTCQFTTECRLLLVLRRLVGWCVRSISSDHQPALGRTCLTLIIIPDSELPPIRTFTELLIIADIVWQWWPSQSRDETSLDVTTSAKACLMSAQSELTERHLERSVPSLCYGFWVQSKWCSRPVFPFLVYSLCKIRDIAVHIDLLSSAQLTFDT